MPPARYTRVVITQRTAVASVMLALCVEAACAQADVQPARSSPNEGREPNPVVQRVVGAVSPARLRADVDRLASFGTRHTLSATDDPARGIGAARRWILDQFNDAAGTSGREGELVCVARLDPHTVAADGRRVVRDAEVVNVVCEIPGSMPDARGRLYFVLGHYDSRAGEANDTESPAPGANDDASGTAVALELARVLAAERLDATVVLMATAGEEQGLLGADRYASGAAREGLDIRAVLSNDIVGDPTGVNGLVDRERVRVFSEGVPRRQEARTLAELMRLGAENDSPSRQIARFVAEVAEVEGLAIRPWVIYRPDRFLRGGDHSAFNDQGFPAVRFTQVHEVYERQHQDVRVEGEGPEARRFGDTPEFVDPEYLAGVARLNAAAIVHLANAPSTPARARVVVAQLANDTTLRWEPSPEPDVAGYEVVWRDTASSRWEHAMDAGARTELTIPLSKDNWLFGVRAYDRDGFRSPVAFPSAATE